MNIREQALLPKWQNDYEWLVYVTPTGTRWETVDDSMKLCKPSLVGGMLICKECIEAAKLNVFQTLRFLLLLHVDQ
jgi:hypothetical protein